MKIEILRSRAYRGQSLDVGRVVVVDANFAGWMVMRGFARYYTEPAPMTAAVESAPMAAEPAPAAEPPKVKRGRPAR
ncbi:MAG: hypothetical protein ACO3S5_12230 [Ilumatobacteraceae bacterium]